jgi:hypothetical protein
MGKRWLVVSAVVVASAPLAVASSAPARGVTFRNRGVYTWKVPKGVTRALLDVYGAQGGDAPGDSSPGSGGLGAHVRASLTTRPGERMTLVVGGQGDSDFPNGTHGGGFPGNGSPGGVGGTCLDHDGGGGGGASDIRTGSGDNRGLRSRVLVAGGGGGGGSDGTSGGAGGRNGATAPSGEGPDSGGGGATHTAGGAGGTDGGQPGRFGIGGAGGDNHFTFCSISSPGRTLGWGGGGGGGGYFGGGGGSAGGLAASFRTATGGGGGSSFITRKAVCRRPIDAGVRHGDGAIVITYNPKHC